jgi:hypothetical protein
MDGDWWKGQEGNERERRGGWEGKGKLRALRLFNSLCCPCSKLHDFILRDTKCATSKCSIRELVRVQLFPCLKFCTSIRNTKLLVRLSNYTHNLVNCFFYVIWNIYRVIV